MAPFSKGRPTSCFIDLEALRWNFSQVRQKVGPKVKILSVLKADAYGHGAVQIARTLAEAESDFFGVATLEEGLQLRESGIRTPVLILAGAYPEQIDELVRYDLTPTVCEPRMLRRMEALAQKRETALHFHLKVDTGMGRIGFAASEIDLWLPEVARLKALELQGMFSHFSHAENVEGGYTQSQLEIFHYLIQRLHEADYRIPLIHLANSAAVISLPASHFNMVRPGLMLYGIHPRAEMAAQVSLKPALSWRTRVLQVKRLPRGSSISYGRTFVTQRESVIATLPVGYADGYPRLLSNRGAVLIRGQRAPVVGRVCMDLTMVDVTQIEGVEEGDEVVLLGKQGGQTVSADEIAGWAETISYEILTSISARVPRIYYSSKEE